MKKRAAFLIALSLAVVTVLAGCGGKDSSNRQIQKILQLHLKKKKKEIHLR